MQSCQMTEKNEDSLASGIDPPPNNIMGIEGVDRMVNETEEREIEGVGSETEGVDSENEGVYNKVLPPEIKGYILRNPPMATTVTREPLGSPWYGTI